MGEPFYSKGLQFSCKRCSSCCRGGPGYVFLSREDLSRILEYLNLDFPAFFKKYCTLVDTGMGYDLSLSEKKNYDCVFWEEGGCAIYEARPVQCSTFPFWASILESPSSWREAGQDCPGICHGELRSREYIEERLWARRAAGTITIGYDKVKDTENIDANTLLGC